MAENTEHHLPGFPYLGVRHAGFDVPADDKPAKVSSYQRPSLPDAAGWPRHARGLACGHPLAGTRRGQGSAGEYTLWRDEHTPEATVLIRGGHVTEHRLSVPLGTGDGHHHGHTHSRGQGVRPGRRTTR